MIARRVRPDAPAPTGHGWRLRWRTVRRYASEDPALGLPFYCRVPYRLVICFTHDQRVHLRHRGHVRLQTNVSIPELRGHVPRVHPRNS